MPADALDPVGARSTAGTMPPTEFDKFAASYRYLSMTSYIFHDDVVKWKHVPRYSPFVRAINRSPMNSPHEGQ